MTTEGKIKVIYADHMGDDNTVVNAARASFGHQSDEYSQEENDRLIRYLASHGHFTTMTHCIISMYIELPIYLHSQLVKHRVGVEVNTLSRRYVRDGISLFDPMWRAAPGGSIKQGSGGEVKPSQEFEQERWMAQSAALQAYERGVSEGLAPEQLRGILPQDLMTKCYVTMSLSAMGRIYSQRTHKGAQKEWKQITDELDKFGKAYFPVSWEALTDEG